MRISDWSSDVCSSDLLVLFGNRGLIGGFLHQHFGLQLAFNWKGAVLASATMAFPLMVQPVRLAFQMIDRRLESAAATLGANPWQVFASISLPLALPGIVAGAILCFSRALGEFGATMRSEARREGKEWVSTGRTRWSPTHLKKN